MKKPHYNLYISFWALVLKVFSVERQCYRSDIFVYGQLTDNMFIKIVGANKLSSEMTN